MFKRNFRSNYGNRGFKSHGQGGFGFRGKKVFGNKFGAKRNVKFFDPTQVIKTNTVDTLDIVQTQTIINSFSDFKIEEKLMKNVMTKNYKNPTPIQDQSIPLLLEGKDLIGIANTGTGKTAAFLIPLINKVIKNRSEKVLIVAPTRELASQIKDEFYDFAKGLGIYTTLCIGGENINRQKNDLRRNPNFVIGTPGRILDLINSRCLNVSQFRSVVLDEADHMVDIGFLKDIEKIISFLPQDRQSLFFSATIDGKVSDVLHKFVKNPVTVSVKTRDTAENVKQEVIKVDHLGNKINILHELLKRADLDKVLIFGRTKHGVQKLSNELVVRGHRADCVHGNKRQSQRLRTLNNFKENRIKILVATDVASRGLDIPNVSHVVNFDLPESYQTYIHRIGRTGRADKKGVAITFTQ